MSKYTGKTITVNRSAQEIADKFGDLSQLKNIAENLPESERAKFGNLEFTSDTISVVTPQVGKISFQVVERTPQIIKFKAVGTPVPLDLAVDMKEQTAESTDMAATIDVQLPMMLRPLVGPQLQKAVDMLTDVVAKVAQR